MFTMRFAMRSRSTDPKARSALYRATLDMCSWADGKGGLAMVSQHHGVEDGYLPSPLTLASAIGARTETLPISVAALLLALYEPVKLAEDMAVLDLLSGGRVSYVIGIGYREEEFDLFGVDRRTRAALVEERIGLLRALFAGEEARLDGRSVRLSPLPLTPGGPLLAYGGGTPAAAKRAARLGMYFFAETHDRSLKEVYRDEAERVGVAPVGCAFPRAGVPLTVFVADDPERAWAELGDYLLVDAAGYGSWKTPATGTASGSFATTVEGLRAERGAYHVLTPEEAGAIVATGQPLGLQPLVGGIPPEIAWPYLEAAVAVAGT
jgi:alkanesulfonate monooxygenase SsuD/methylene tetrahydromethanopterin reductase-like flavin-dependent oxidoreductase (luciferase family)